MANEFVVRKGLISLGGITVPHTQVSSLYTIVEDDYLIECTSGTFDVNLPTSVGVQGKLYVIKNSGNGIISVKCSGSENIDGFISYPLISKQSLSLQSNGSNWIVITPVSQFYYQSTVPMPNPTVLGARWLDNDNGIEYVWVYDGASYVWMQPTQLGNVVYQTGVITTANYSPNFALEYYGVTYMGGICTITLPIADNSTDEGKFITIADEVGGISWANRGILVQGTGGQLINGETSVLMKIERMSLTFMFRNNSWKTI